MDARAHAVRLGVRGGITALGQSLRSAQDQGYYLLSAVLVLGYLFIRRDDGVPGTDLGYVEVALPSILGASIAYGMVIGPAYQLAMDREDGTLLRYRAIPHGLRGYFTSQLTLHTVQVIPGFLVVMIPAMLLFEISSAGLGGWLTVAGVAALGVLATLPVGIIIGALSPSVQKVGMWGMFPVFFLTAVSGIFFPIQQLWGWLQVVAQLFPTYWIGLGMRSGFLPDSAASAELGGSWHTPETLLVLGAWAAAGWIITPVVLRRMSRRQSGSAVEAARANANQWIR